MCKCSGFDSGASNKYETFAPPRGGEFEGDFEGSKWEAENGAKAQTLPPACGAEVVTTVRGVKLWRLKGDDKAIFFEAGMTIDADGAPNAYHPDDLPGLDHLSNAGRRGHWSSIETDCGGNPVVQRQGCDPFPGFFISRTSLQDPDRCKSLVEKQVDSRFIPYIVLPTNLPGVKLGDFALVINRANCSMAAAIFADTKGHVGEGSMALADFLNVPSNPRHGGTGSGILYIVFPGSGNRKPRHILEIIGNVFSLYNTWAGNAKLMADCFPGCPPFLPSSTQPGGAQQEWSTPLTRRSKMRYDLDFEAEPFQGYTEFDEMELLDARAARGREGEVNRKSPAYVSRVQSSLNRLLGLRLAVDGVEGTQTRSALRSLQKRRGLNVTGVIDPKTEQALFAGDGGKGPGSKEGDVGAASAPTCGTAAGDLENLANSLRFLNNALSRTPPNPTRVRLLKELVRMDTEAIIGSLSHYVAAGCCEPSLKVLEADVRALPWPADPDVLLQRDRLISAIQKAQAAAKQDTEHC